MLLEVANGRSRPRRQRRAVAERWLDLDDLERDRHRRGQMVLASNDAANHLSPQATSALNNPHRMPLLCGTFSTAQ